MPSGDEELALLDTLTMEPFPKPLKELLLPASAAVGMPAGVEMREVAREVLSGSAEELAAVRMITDNLIVLGIVLPMYGCCIYTA
jgi:hypothetical protein